MDTSSRTAVPGYRDLLARPGALAFFIPGFIGRLPLAMRALGCILLVQELTGSFGLAGLVGAVQTVASALASPRIGRFADQHGERGVLIWALLTHPSATAGLIGTTYADAPVALILLTAALLGGSSVPYGSFSRARWTSMLGRGPGLDRAYALESTIEEAAFIIGPTVAIPLSVEVNPAAGLIAAGLMTTIATLGFARLPDRVATHVTGPALPVGLPDRRRSAIAVPGIRVLVAASLALGTIFGAAELMLIAFAEEQGAESAATILLGLFALGSMVAAIGYGAITWRVPLDRRLLIAVIWLWLGTIPMLIAGSIPVMAVIMFLAGLAIAPGIISATSLIERIVPASMLTEGFAWQNSALATGAAVGAVLAGWLIDELGPLGGQLVAVGGGAFAVIALVLGASHLRTGSDGHAVPEPAQPAHADG